MTRKQKTATIAFASILLLSVISITYAFFTTSVNDATSDNVTVTSGSLSLTLNDMDVHSLTAWNITPSDLSRTVYISLTNNSPISVDARLLFRGLTNTYSEYLVYTVEEVNSNKTSLSTPNILINQSGVPESASASNKTMVNRITLTSNTTKYYKVTIQYLYSTTVNQSSDVGKKFYTGFGLEENTDPTALSQYIKTKVYGTEPTLYLHSDTATGNNETSIANWTNAESGNANDGAYRYSGADASVNNYVCFNYTNVSECTDANFATSDVAYRIISIDNDDSIKLIKAKTLSNTYNWTNDCVNAGSMQDAKSNFDYNLNLLVITPGPSVICNKDWSTVYLNRQLNNTVSGFLSTINSLWIDKILTHKTWYVGGYDSYSVKVKTFYSAEHGTCSSGICPGTTDANTTIGLMNVYDYGYGTSPINWNTDTLYNYNNMTIASNNWLYRYDSNNEWTISPVTNSNLDVFDVANNGRTTYFYGNYGRYVRPVFYLNSNTEFTDGTGTSSNPYVIKP